MPKPLLIGVWTILNSMAAILTFMIFLLVRYHIGSRRFFKIYKNFMNFWIDLLFPYQTFTLSFVCVHNTYTQTLKRTTKHKEIWGKCVWPPHRIKSVSWEKCIIYRARSSGTCSSFSSIPVCLNKGRGWWKYNMYDTESWMGQLWSEYRDVKWDRVKGGVLSKNIIEPEQYSYQNSYSRFDCIQIINGTIFRC